MDASPSQSLALAVGLGSLVTMISIRMGIPAVLPLLIVGLAVGDSGINLIDADQLGSGLLALISVSVALLIFEGSLALDRRTLKQAPRAVRNLLSIGVLVTWGLGTLAAHFVVGLDWSLSLLLASLLIVTGPTVVQPILRRIPLRPNLQSALMAEGILIDPIGAIIAVATLEAVRASLEGHSESALGLTWIYVGPMVIGMVSGIVLGLAGGKLMQIAERRAGPRAHAGPLALIGMGACMSAVGFAEMFAHEAGLVAAAVCGVIIANSRLDGAEELRRFKEQISTFLVGTLFLLLAARFELNQIFELPWTAFVFIVLVVVVIRPVSVLASTFGTGLSWRERAFASFLAPRGIVAASLASIVALEFAKIEPAGNAPPERAAQLEESGRMVETLVFLVILVTVALGGTLSGVVASLLKVRAGRPTGVLIVGGQRLGRDLAVALTKLGVKVRLVDTNAGNIAAASSWSIPTHLGDATDTAWLESEVPLEQIGWVFTCTDNQTVDLVVTRWAERVVGADRAFRWVSNPEKADGPGRPSFAYGRPLAHLLFQMDIETARVETWEGLKDGGLPFAAVDDGVPTLLGDGDEIPEGATVVGVRIGPKEPKED